MKALWGLHNDYYQGMAETSINTGESLLPVPFWFIQRFRSLRAKGNLGFADEVDSRLSGMLSV